MMTPVSGRGATHCGQRSPLPAGRYDPHPDSSTSDQLAVAFVGEDGRTRTFDIASLPLPGWHQSITVAWSTRTGPGGSLRTLSSAVGSWRALKRFLRYIAALPNPPRSPADLTSSHLAAFRADITLRTRNTFAATELRLVGKVLNLPPLGQQLDPAALAFAQQRAPGRRFQPTPGYSDGELRRLLGAARSDTAKIRDRIRNGAAQVEQRAGAPSMPATSQAEAEAICAMMTTGHVPTTRILGEHPTAEFHRAAADAQRVFVLLRDLPPLLTLMVAVSGRNIETIKELPAQHKILDGRAVQVRLIKRRRGPRRWTETVTWEIGSPDRALHTPGGLYLLLHELMANGRRHSGSATLWSVWRHQLMPAAAGWSTNHGDPFQIRLGHIPGGYAKWAAIHDLQADPATPDDPPRPLHVTMQRVRTSIEVRRTKQLGGHLPSAARSNTVPVLFRNYLSGDPTTRDWAHDVIADALVDAEQSALAAHRAAWDPQTTRPKVLPSMGAADTGSQEGPWSTCVNPSEHPRTHHRCSASFLDCFHCSNCVVKADHLPRLLGLVEVLRDRRQQMSELDWWQRYGPVWSAVRVDILTKFTPAQIDDGRPKQPTDVLLDLVETPWERT